MLELKAEPRAVLGKKVKSLRKTGFIPAVLYGRVKKPESVTVNAKEFDKVFKLAGKTALVDLVVGGGRHNVFIHDLEKNLLDGQIVHIDFFEVRMDEKVRTKVPFVFIGESPAVKAEGGVLVRAMQEVEIEALPQNLPKEIKVDISLLKLFEDKIRVGDLALGDNIKILANRDETIVLVSPPRSDKELEELEAKPVETVDEIKVVGEEEKAAEEAEAGDAEAGEKTAE